MVGDALLSPPTMCFHATLNSELWESQMKRISAHRVRTIDCRLEFETDIWSPHRSEAIVAERGGYHFRYSAEEKACQRPLGDQNAVEFGSEESGINFYGCEKILGSLQQTGFCLDKMPDRLNHGGCCYDMSSLEFLASSTKI